MSVFNEVLDCNLALNLKPRKNSSDGKKLPEHTSKENKFLVVIFLANLHKSLYFCYLNEIYIVQMYAAYLAVSNSLVYFGVKLVTSPHLSNIHPTGKSSLL